MLLTSSVEDEDRLRSCDGRHAGGPLRVLILEDSPDDAELMLLELRGGGYEPTWVRVNEPLAFAAALDEPWDVILSDYEMPSFTARDALEMLKRSEADIPFLVVSGSIGEDVAVSAMKAGANDFFRKENMARLAPAIARERREAEIRRTARRAQKWLRTLADAGKLLTESLEPGDVVHRVSEAAILDFSELCVVDLLDGGSFLYRAAATARAGSPGERLGDLLERHPPRWEAPEPAVIALRSASTVRILDLRRPTFGEGSAIVALGKELHLSSLLSIPLRARGRLIGAVNALSPEVYDDMDVRFLEELAGRGALAIDNARLYAGARDAVKVRDEFLSIAGHELNTPLAALQLQLESLQRHAQPGQLLTERAASKLALAVRHTGRVARLVGLLLDVSRFAGGAFQLAIDDHDLARIVRDAVSTYEELARAAGATLVVTAPESVPFRGDRARVEQVLGNLLANAIKHGGGKVIDVRLEAGARWATLCVSDEGEGIAPERLASIFERFDRGGKDTNLGGLGLGLYVARRIAEAHGGSLAVKSPAGKGATFVLRLPRLGPEVAPGDGVA